MPGSVVVVDGPSSAGKSTLVSAVQPLLPRPFVVHGLDAFLFGPFLPRDADGRVRDWPVLRPRVLDAHRRSVRALADAGLDVLVDVVLETQEQADALASALDGLDVLWVALTAPLDELRRRERARGDRAAGDAERDLLTAHTFRAYDLALDSGAGVAACADALVRTWRQR